MEMHPTTKDKSVSGEASTRRSYTMEYILLLILGTLAPTRGLVWKHTPLRQPMIGARRLAVLHSGKVDELLDLVQESESSPATIRERINTLSDRGSTNMDPLFGYYNVTSIVPVKVTDRPVGGKWNAFKILQSSQHIVPARSTQFNDSDGESSEAPAAAQVINLVALRVLAWTMTILLRGDAYLLSQEERTEIENERNTTLSPRTVRADFDPPRILMGKKLAFSIGPTSSVVLDTPYCDEKVRIGKGARGTLFVFSRVDMDDSYASLLERAVLRKRSLLSFFGAITGLSLTAALRWSVRWWVPIATTSGLCTLGVALSTGGIVQDRKASAQG